jgi:hypothetical protein
MNIHCNTTAFHKTVLLTILYKPTCTQKLNKKCDGNSDTNTDADNWASTIAFPILQKVEPINI